MKENLISYLFFLKKKYTLKTLHDPLFHLCRFLNINDLVKWEKLFFFNNYEVYDNDFDEIKKTLIFHNYIDSNGEITYKGLSYLEKNENTYFYKSILEFNLHYNGESSMEKSCFTETPFHNVSCAYCTEPICVENKIKLIDLLPNKLKYIKNPYKSWSL